VRWHRVNNQPGQPRPASFRGSWAVQVQRNSARPIRVSRHLVAAWIRQGSSRIRYLWRLTDSKVSILFSGLGAAHAGAGSVRSRTISDRMSANICRGTDRVAEGNFTPSPSLTKPDYDRIRTTLLHGSPGWTASGRLGWGQAQGSGMNLACRR